MKRLGLVFTGLAFLLSGCVVRSYQLTRDRVDQDLSAGNKGYLTGQAPAESKERKPTRTTNIVEIELRSPIRFEKAPKKAAIPAVSSVPAEDEGYGNRGYVSQSDVPETAESAALENYVVQKGDTLQKVSQKFYGTTKNWHKIYEANKETLKSPDRLYPGKTIVIPNLPKAEKTSVPQGNLK